MLLDEIDAHLHPRWKMRIVASLRRTFPRVQFLAATHEPLCLRGLRAGEILVLRRQEGRVVWLRPSEDVSALRVDQILTSRLFGLHTALDPELEEQLDHYYRLLSLHETVRTPEQAEELANLARTIGGRGVLGSTPRDRLLYQALDYQVAQKQEAVAGTASPRWSPAEIEAFWQQMGGKEGKE